MNLLEGKVIAVTGAGRGIGREEALLLAREGARVVVNDLGGEWDGTGEDTRVATEVASEIEAAGGAAAPHFEDISEPEGAASLVETALDRWGRIDGLVNNAGILRDRMTFNMAPEEWDAVIKVHLRGTFLCTAEVCRRWRELAKGGEDVSGRRIVNTSSTSGLLGMVGQSNYGTAKAGIAAFTQIVSMEMRSYGVGVNAIAPGARTRMTEKTFGDLRVEGDFDPLDPGNIAPLVAFLCSDSAAGITGQVFGITGGLVELYQSWTPVSELDKGARWEASGLAERMDELFGKRPRSYEPGRSPLRRITGIGG
ncbi:MAG TPA: SDR family NAD(P)-dependent oxidoreductase [Actinomycetota bacterium]